MTTAITDIYNEIRTLISAALTGKGYTQIPNAYLQASNAELLLAKGYGISIGPGTNTARQVGCQRSYQREFGIFLTRQITTTDHNITAREDIEKDILEDFNLILKEFEKNPTLNDKAANGMILSDAGLEFLESDRARFYMIEAILTVEYFENL